MPVRVTHGNGYLYKEHGVHNGSTGKLRGWELEDLDLQALQQSSEPQVVLRALPKKLIVKFDKPLKKQYHGLDENCFPLSPVTVYWTLDADEHIDISRRGFPIVPNFSTTIDGATGKTLDTAIADLGDFQVLPSFNRAMKGYIALSRVKKAEDIFLAQSFSPTLFQQGPQPWSTLLMEHLRGEEGEIDLQESVEQTKRAVRKKANA